MANHSRKMKLFPLMLVLLTAAAFLLTGCRFLPDLDFLKPDEPSAQTEPPTQADDGIPMSADNPYRAYYDPDGGYILPDSDQRYYTRAELQNLNSHVRALALHEISARHGQMFDDPYVQEYFSAMPWYESAISAWAANEYEQVNMVMLSVMIREADGTLGNNGNPYIASGDLVREQIGDSDSRYLAARDLENLSAEELVIVRTEIMARHGVIFLDQDLLEFFCCRPNYTPSVSEDEFDAESLSDYETVNIQLIRVYEKIRNGDYTPSANNPYMAYYDPTTELILPKSSDTELTARDLIGYNEDQLIIIRNQIIALDGYTFKDQHLMEYFLQCSWYKPSTPPGRSDLVDQTSLERKNMRLIQEIEEDPLVMPDLWSLDTALTYRVENDAFSVYVPAYWKDYCVIEVDDDEMRFYESLSYASGDGGYLFSLYLASENDSLDYTDYTLYGKVLDKDGKVYDLVMGGPFDVPAGYFIDLYAKMAREKNAIMETFQFKDGYGFAP